MGEYVEGLAVAAIVVTLIVSAATKVVDPASLRATLEELGVPAGPSRIAVPALSLTESAAAALIAIAPSSVAAQLLVAGLFAVFAAAGVWSMAGHRALRCACFGALRAQARLGKTQVVQFLAVLGLIGALRASPPLWDATTGALGFDACLMVASGVILLGGSRDWRATRAARISLTQTRLLMQRVAAEVEWHA